MSGKGSRGFEGKARVLLNLLSDPAVIVDQQGLLIMVNDEFEKVTGLKTKEIIGMPFLSFGFLPAESKAQLLQNLSRRLQGLSVAPYEVAFQNSAGERRYVEVKGKRITYAGQPADLVLFHDVTRRKENARRIKEYAEMMEALVEEKIREIKESEEKFRTISTCATDAIVAVNSEGEVVYWNPAAEQIFGYRQEEAVGKNVLNLIIPQRDHGFQKVFAQKVQSKQLPLGEFLEFTARRKDGTEFPAELSVALMNFKGATCLLGIVRDVSERKEVEAALKDSLEREHFLAELVRNASVAVAVGYPDGRLGLVNAAFEKLTGYSARELEKINWATTLTPPEYAEFEKAKLAELQSTKKPVRYQKEYIRKDGSIVPIELFVHPFLDCNGDVAHYFAFITDITERQKAQSALEQSEAQYRSLFENSFDGIMLTKPDGTILAANPQACRMLGMTEEEVKQAGREGIVVKDANLAAALKEREQTGRTRAELTFIRKDGTTFIGEVSSIVFTDTEGVAKTSMVIRDISERKKTEEIIRDAEARYRQLFNTIPSGVAVYRAVDNGDDFAFVDFNQTAERIEKIARKNLLGKRVTEVFPGIKELSLLNVFKRVYRTGQAEYLPSKIYKDGRIFGWRENWVYKLPNGNIVAVYNDVTERKEAEEALRKSEEKHRVISQMTADFLFSCLKVNDKASFHIDWMAGATEKIFGYSPTEIKNESCWKFTVQPQDLPIFNEKVIGLKLGQSSVCELRITNKDGSTRWLKVSSRVITDEENPSGQRLFGACEDITEKKRIEEALCENEEKLRGIFEASPDPIAVSSPGSTIIDCNSAALKMFGYSTKSEVIGRNVREFFAERAQARAAENFERQGNTLINAEYIFRTKNGREFLGELSTSPVLQSSGKVAFFVSTVKDITERKQKEKALRESEERFKQVAENAEEWIWEVDPEGMYTYSSPVVEKILGYSPEEIVGKKRFYDLFHPENRKQIKKAAFEAFRKKQSFHGLLNKNVHKNGKAVWLSTSGVPIVDDEGKLVGYRGTDINITEAKKAEEDLRVSEEKFRAISNSVRDAIILVNDKEIIEYWNPAAEKTFGYTREEAVGRKVHELVVPSSFCPEGKEAMTEGVAQFAQTGKGNFINETIELTATRKGGTEFPIKLSLSPIKLGNKWHAVGVAKDITEQKQNEQMAREYSEKLEKAITSRTRELQTAQANLLKLERLAAIGELAGMVGHDLRNPLTGIKNAAYYLKVKESSKLGDNGKKMLAIIDNAVTHADKIIGDLQDYAREMHLDLTECTPRSILNETLTLIRVPNKIHIANNAQEKPLIKADKTKMARVFINIIKNAIDAMPEGGTLRIKSSQTDGNVKISFTDTGTGIPKEMLHRLFSPLVTTKAQGMGFGLAICKRIVEAHQGKITVQTREGKGSTFTIILPIEPKLKNGGGLAWINLPESLSWTTTKT
ncbi:MAG: PAS domain S-box protein [Candidatus Bathyarchaeota archaeon]|nr:PAS domain S-box protein [Candidatus Bathyarchaeota archaeon]